MMTRAEKTYFFDRVIDEGLANPLYICGANGAELQFRCPIREHEHDSARKTAFRVNIDKLTWYCFKCGRGGTAFQLAEAVLGSRAAALQMYRVVKQRSNEAGTSGFRLKVAKSSDLARRRKEEKADPPKIETGDVATFLCLDGLVKYNHLRDESCFYKVQHHPVTWNDAEWLGFPTLTPGSWKLWGFDWDGRIRRDRGAIQKRNVGPVSVVASDTLRDVIGAGQPIPILYDVEGEGDLLCAIEYDLDPVLTSTGGAGTTQGHERCGDLLSQLELGEVRIVRDRDDAGRHGAKLTSEFWGSLGVSAKIIELPEEVGDGGDLRDYFALLGGGQSRHGEKPE